MVIWRLCALTATNEGAWQPLSMAASRIIDSSMIMEYLDEIYPSPKLGRMSASGRLRCKSRQAGSVK
jgi:glutathione S-transferase